jgi:hypothetical protein
MENNEENKKENDNNDDIFTDLSLYTDRAVELINKNIIDYSSKWENLIIF